MTENKILSKANAKHYCTKQPSQQSPLRNLLSSKGIYINTPNSVNFKNLSFSLLSCRVKTLSRRVTEFASKLPENKKSDYFLDWNLFGTKNQHTPPPPPPPSPGKVPPSRLPSKKQILIPPNKG